MRMKKTVLLRLTALVLCVMLLPVSFAFAELIGKTEETIKEKGQPGVNPATLFSWYYTTAELPAGSTPAENTLRIDRLYPEKLAGRNRKEGTLIGEKVTSATVNWKEGSYALVKAIQVTVDDKGAEIRLIPEKMKWSGSTVVTLVLESEHYRYETEQTLTILNAQKTPSFTQKVFNPVFNVSLGSTFTAQDLLGAIVTIDYPAYCKANKLAYPDAEVQVDETEIEGISKNEKTGIFTLEEYGVYDLSLKLRIANLEWKLPFRLEAEPYSITGPGFVMPGSTNKYRVTDQDAAVGRGYTWSVEGDGVTIDPKDGTLTVAENAKANTYIKVELTPDNDPAISTSVLVPEGVLPAQLYVLHEPEEEKGKKTREDKKKDKKTDEAEPEEEPETPAAPAPLTETEAGFSVAVPEGDNWNTGVSESRQDGWMFRCVTTGTGGATVAVDARTDQITTGFREDDLAAMSYYNENQFPETVRNLQSRDIRIDGHLAREYLFTVVDQNGQATHFGQICYCRNNQALTARVFTMKQGAGAENLIPVTMKDLDRIAEGIHYKTVEDAVTREDALLILTVPHDEEYILAGKRVPLKVEFANPEKVNSRAKNDGIRWEIKDAETGEMTDAASVNGKNLLTVNRDIGKKMTLEITAVSETYGTKASDTITVCPMTQVIAVEPETIYWYRNRENPPVTVQAAIVPEIPANMLTWTVADPKKMTIEPKDDGTAVLTFLRGGNNTVTVTAPDGATGRVRIRTVTPVRNLKIERKGNAKPGRQVTYKAKVEPKIGTVQDVVWTIDGGEDVATINEQGEIFISPEAVPGTVITVTCRAIGSPDQITASDLLVVE